MSVLANTSAIPFLCIASRDSHVPSTFPYGGFSHTNPVHTRVRPPLVQLFTAHGHGCGSAEQGSKSNGPSAEISHFGVIHESVVIPARRVWQCGAIEGIYFFRHLMNRTNAVSMKPNERAERINSIHFRIEICVS